MVSGESLREQMQGLLVVASSGAGWAGRRGHQKNTATDNDTEKVLSRMEACF